VIRKPRIALRILRGSRSAGGADADGDFLTQTAWFRSESVNA